MKTNRYVIEAYEAAELIEAYGSRQAALEAAIDIARERARIYHMPAQWEAHWKNGCELTIIVTCKHN